MANSWITTEGFCDSPVMLGASRIKIRKEECTLPIKDLTEIDRPPRQGMIRLGSKKKTTSGKEYPYEVDYFILDPETPEEAEKKRIIDLFHEKFGNQPRVIDVMLIQPEPGKEQFPQSYKRYGKTSGLKCIGDGEEAACLEQQYTSGLTVTGKDERGFDTVICRGKGCVFAIGNEVAKIKECKATATLSLVIKELGGLGCWQVTTGSFNSIVNLNSAIRELTRLYGQPYGIPLKLERRPQETRYKGKTATHYTLHLNSNGDMEKFFKKSKVTIEEDEFPPPLDNDVVDAEFGEGDRQDMTTGRAFKEMAEKDLTPEQKQKCDEMLDKHVTGVIENTCEVKSAQFGKAVLDNIKKKREDDVKEEASIDAIASRDEEPETGVYVKPQPVGPHEGLARVATEQKQKAEVIEKVQLVVDTFGAQEVIIEEHEKLDMPGAAMAEKVKENREAKKAESKMPDEFFAWYTKARRMLSEAKLIVQLDKVWIERDVKSTSELAKDKEKQARVRDDINKILEANSLI
jgi:hypothetical protein